MKKGTLSSVKPAETPHEEYSPSQARHAACSKSCALKVLRVRSCPGAGEFPPLHYKKGGLQKKQKFQTNETTLGGKPEC